MITYTTTITNKQGRANDFNSNQTHPFHQNNQIQFNTMNEIIRAIAT